MTIREIYNYNIKLQYRSSMIVRAVHQQNHAHAFYNLGSLIKELSSYLVACTEQKEVLGIEIEEYGIGDFLKNIMDAQNVSDYILIADLIEMQMIPFLLSVQENIRNNCDTMFCQEIWDENIERLRKKDGKLAALVEAEQKKWMNEENPLYWLEPTNSGLFTMASRDDKGVYYIHSNSNPQLEAFDFAEYYYDLECEKYVVLGLGLGYHCQALMDKDEGAYITIYENDLQVIVQAMMANVLDWIWGNDRITLVYDSDLKELSGRLVQMETKGEKVNFLLHHPSIRHVDNATVREKLEQLFVRDGGIRYLRGQMESNFRNNIRNHTGVVDELRSNFVGKRAVIVAAGPSLDRNVELLLNKPEDVIIVAVGTVFRKLMALGIAVDYVIVSDAKKSILGQFADYMDSSVPLLYLSTAYQGVAQNYSGERYIIFQQGYESATNMAKELCTDTYRTGGSVSTIALEICIRLGCASIAFIGLDLAFTDNFAHAEGTSRRALVDMEGMPKVEGYEIVMEEKTDTGMYNNEVSDTKIKKVELFSSKLFDMYRHWIEKRIADPDVHIPIFDASEGGSVKKGMRICTLEEYLKKE